METRGYIDLLIVNVSEKLYAVEAPPREANEGDLVVFAADTFPALGNVVDKMFCAKGEEEYRCISHLRTIYPATRIYKAMWAADENASE